MTPERTLANRIRLAGLRLVGKGYARPTTPTCSVSRPKPHSILLIRPDHLGDMLFLTPALHALRAAVPAARLTLLAGPWGAEVMHGNPDLDEIRLCRFPGFERAPKRSALAPYRVLTSTAVELQAGNYDVAVILRFDHWWGAWLAAAAGIPRRIGYDWQEARPFLTQTVQYVSDRHEVVQNARLLEQLMPELGTDLGPLRYYPAPSDRAWADTWLASRGLDAARPLIAIHAGAGAEVKQWEPEAWAFTADALAGLYQAQILLTGSGGERSLTQAIRAQVPAAIDATGETTLGQLAALQARCALVLGSDCGPLHLATAVETPTVHLYGPVTPIKFGPWGDPARHRVITTSWSCAPCNRLDWPARALSYHRCMAAITPDQVLAAVAEILR